MLLLIPQTYGCIIPFATVAKGIKIFDTDEGVKKKKKNQLQQNISIKSLKILHLSFEYISTHSTNIFDVSEQSLTWSTRGRERASCGKPACAKQLLVPHAVSFNIHTKLHFLALAMFYFTCLNLPGPSSVLHTFCRWLDAWHKCNSFALPVWVCNLPQHFIVLWHVKLRVHVKTKACWCYGGIGRYYICHQWRWQHQYAAHPEWDVGWSALLLRGLRDLP